MKNFLGGLAAGLAIGYLTAPRSGKDTRAQLSESVDGMKEHWEEAKVQITELIEDLKEQAGISSKDEMVSNTQDTFDQYKHEVDQKKELVTDQYHENNRYGDQTNDFSDTTRPGINSTDNIARL